MATGSPSRLARRAVTSSAGPSGERLRLVVVGHVDHGKSTLIGRLLHDTGSLPDGKYEQLAAAAARRGVPFEFANLTDALQAERDQNATIDTAHVGFRTARRECVLIDAPGHREFLKNMVTGAAAADAAIVIVDAQEGVREQSRRHGTLLKLLGIEQVAVAVNKLDLVEYAQAAFERIAGDYTAFLAGLGITPRAVVPISARFGDNIAARSARTPWYAGGTIVDLIDAFTVPRPAVDRPLRLPLQAVYRFDHRRILAGRLESGTLRVGDRLLFLPSGKQSTVKTIEQWHAPARRSAVAGDAVGLTLVDQLFLGRGEVASRLDDAPSTTSRFTARLFWLGRQPFRTGRSYRFKLATQEFDGEAVAITAVTDAATLEGPAAPGDGGLSASEVGEITVRTRRPVVLDPYDRVPHLGRFVVVDGLDVCGGGIVLDADEAGALMPATSANLTRPVGYVSCERRQARHGHRGAVVWFTGLSGAGKSTLAAALERELFARGWEACVLDGDNVRVGLSADLGFTAADRAENLRRVAEVARLFAEQGLIAITAFISPSRTDRLRARQILGREGLDVPFAEVYLSTPLAACEARDPKRLYARARAGEIGEFTGISAPFEPPDHADLVIDTSAVGLEEAVAQLVEYLAPRLAVS
ncbi:MAG TPA: adenylyl-sulfate kinase [Vicinamibacterales bacterium]|nr:adenylyl-sulfate kinase [Vicinamibacterales bacterium]